MAKIIEILENTILDHLDSRESFEGEILRVCAFYGHRISDEEHFERIYAVIYEYAVILGADFL